MTLNSESNLQLPIDECVQVFIIDFERGEGLELLTVLVVLGQHAIVKCSQAEVGQFYI
jgi:hypothetical protein